MVEYRVLSIKQAHHSVVLSFPTDPGWGSLLQQHFTLQRTLRTFARAYCVVWFVGHEVDQLGEEYKPFHRNKKAKIGAPVSNATGKAAHKKAVNPSRTATNIPHKLQVLYPQKRGRRSERTTGPLTHKERASYQL